jgi:hypothetical protein
MDSLRLIAGEQPNARHPVVRRLAGASFGSFLWERPWGASASTRQASKISHIERAGLLARPHRMRKTLRKIPNVKNTERDCEKKVT